MLRPLVNNVLIRPEAAPETTASGLHLVEHWRPENLGTVIATGPYSETECPECLHRHSVPMSVEVGDTVLFPQNAGQEVTVGEDRYLLLRETDLIAVWED